MGWAKAWNQKVDLLGLRASLMAAKLPYATGELCAAARLSQQIAAGIALALMAWVV